MNLVTSNPNPTLIILMNRSSQNRGSNDGLILERKVTIIINVSFRFKVSTTNNHVKYEVFITNITLKTNMRETNIKLRTNS